MKEKDWTLIIDSHYLCYRTFHTIPKEYIFREDDTNIVYGFLNQIKKLSEDFKTNKFVFCFDSSKSYRKMVYPQYKIKDFESDQQLANLIQAKKQFAKLREEVLPAMGFKNIYHQTGYEADDLIAELCYRFPDDYMIISADEDLFQLLFRGPVREVQIYNYKKIMIVDDFTKSLGITPAQWKLVKAMAGCKSDTIEGIEGVGETKAIQYLLGTLPDGKIKERIKSSKDIIIRNMALIGLPYLGIKPIKIYEYPVKDVLYTIDFMEAFKICGFGSFLVPEVLDKWRRLFNLQAGSRV